MSLRDLFREIHTEQSQEKPVPKTNSIIVKNIALSNLDLNGVFPTAVDFVLQSKSKGLTAVVTFKTPEEASEIAKRKVTIDGQEIQPKLLVDDVREKKGSKPQKGGGKKQHHDGKKPESVLFETVSDDEDVGKKIHLWKLTKNIKVLARKNWTEIKKEQLLMVDGQRKALFVKEINFLRNFLKFLENHKQKVLFSPDNTQNFPPLNLVQKDELLWSLRKSLLTCIDQQLDVVQSAKMRPGDKRVVTKFTKEFHFLRDCRQMLTTKVNRKRPKTSRRPTKTPK
ncbi:hypothetical protein DMENIID0001_082850 [Sergentomyia squamirostris]